MGEQQLDEGQVAYLRELENWLFPITEWEVQTVAEISALPTVRVTRCPDDLLEHMQMTPRLCHANARFMQENDPDKRLKQVTGWWLQDGQYLLHSVVDRYGTLVCVTPVPLHDERTFDFIPDAKIEWRDEGNHRNAYRDGVEIGPGVRSNPEETIKELKGLKDRILAGENPYYVEE